MEQLLALEMVRVTEAAAIASARFMGRGDRHEADRAATEAMRRTMDETDIAGTIVIGEGERDEAPMLYIGEQVGRHDGDEDAVAAVDIAVDPLEGTNLVADRPGRRDHGPRRLGEGRPDARARTPTSRSCAWARSRPAAWTSPGRRPRTATASPRRSGAASQDITVIILDRPRHESLIAEVRSTGARIKLISRRRPLGRHLVRGPGHRRARGDGHRRGARGRDHGRGAALPGRRDPGRASGSATTRSASARRPRRCSATPTRTASTGPRTWPRATSSCSPRPASRRGELLQGVRFFGGGARTHSLVMAYQSKQVRFVDTVHMFDRDRPPAVRL